MTTSALSTTVVTLIDVDGVIDAAALHRAAGVLTTRHPHLRPAPDADLPWHDADLSAVPPVDRGAGLARIDAEEDGAPAVPLRLSLTKLDDSRHRLRLSSDPAAVDAQSHRVLVEELFAVYAGKEDELPRVPSVSDFHGWLAVQDRAAADRAWADHLTSVEPTLVAGVTDVGAGRSNGSPVSCRRRSRTGCWPSRTTTDSRSTRSCRACSAFCSAGSPAATTSCSA